LSPAAPRLRGYRPTDEAAAVDVWRRSWQRAYPAIDFSARLTWWQARWRDELVGRARITVAEIGDELVGFVTVDRSGYLDQIVVAPQAWGSGVGAALIAEAKRLSANGLTLHVNVDNARAIGFYRKHGFRVAGHDINPHSGAAVLIMDWGVAKSGDADPSESGPAGPRSG
jgi:putative acetyltransferase